MSEVNGKAVAIDQADDFATFTIDGVQQEVDLYAAHDALAKVDLKHDADDWYCFGCCSVQQRPAADTLRMVDGVLVPPVCPTCSSEAFRRDDVWLDDVAAWVRTLGFARCSRNTAGEVYVAVVNAMEAIKKKRLTMLESLTCTED